MLKVYILNQNVSHTFLENKKNLIYEIVRNLHHLVTNQSYLDNFLIDATYAGLYKTKSNVVLIRVYY